MPKGIETVLGKRIVKGCHLAPYTTFRIGGRAEWFMEPCNSDEIKQAVNACRNYGIHLTIFGGGSNILVPDEGIAGLVMRIYQPDVTPFFHNGAIHVNAAVSNSNLAGFAARHGICGFEFIYDIPGAVGGAIVQNAANNDGMISEHLIDVEFIDRKSESIKVLQKKDLNFGYRHSYFKDHDCVVISARFAAAKRADPSDIRYRMEAIKKQRWEKFPMEYPNCGSVFKRPAGDYAGRLIEQAGLGGYRIGDAMVSTKHKGFIVNVGKATAADVRTLIESVRSRIGEKFGVWLENELVILSDGKGG